jgi:hypothetical protein
MHHRQLATHAAAEFANKKPSGNVAAAVLTLYY